jgi:hypothetical protein
MGVGRDDSDAESDNIAHSWMDDDFRSGWVLDSYKRRLLWVPTELCPDLVFLPTSPMIADGGCFQLRTDGWKIGDEWTDCYRP